MKILMVNKFHYVKGGSERYYFALKRLLERHGHTVIDFSMKDEKNEPSAYSEYFVDNVDYNQNPGTWDKVKMGLNIIYSKAARDKFEALVQKEKPDVVHLHLFQHQLSPSILDVLKKYEIPAVYTAHDLKMLCLNYKMMHHGKVCEECRGGKYYNCAKNRCVKDSFAKSCINVAEGYLHKWRKSYDAIGAIITPSAFYRKMFRRFGIAPERVTHIPNFLDSQEPYVYPMADSKQYYLYLGRLSEEKGLMTLLQAVRNQPIRLRIAGTGPMEEELNAYIQRHRMYNVHMMGFQSGQALTDLIGNAKAVVLPSEWYENGPYAAIEALQLGRPIIGADIGGIPELVEGNGYLFESGSAEDLQRVLLWMDELTADNYAKLELASRELFRKNYTEESHYRALQKVYASVGVKLD